MITSVGRDAEKGVLLHAAVRDGNAQLLWRQVSSESEWKSYHVTQQLHAQSFPHEN